MKSSQLPYQEAHARRGSGSLAARLGLRGIASADWLQIASVLVATAVIWIALYYTR